MLLVAVNERPIDIEQNGLDFHELTPDKPSERPPAKFGPYDFMPPV
jgi:hypothetical protein